MTAASTVVFLGPSLPREEARRILDAEYRPPARMGDLYDVLSSRLESIVLVDGLFHGVPSVWHREILDALDQGVRVWGASSMGALRAAELHGYGMRGVGTVFEWYRDGVIDADDEVALLHASEADGFRPLSEPLVNVRFTLQRAVANGRLDARRADQLVEECRSTHYADRSWKRLLDGPAARSWPPEALAALASDVAERRCDVKRTDAELVLRRCAAAEPFMADDATSLAPKSVFWDLGRLLRSRFGRGPTALGETVLERALARTEVWGPLWTELATRRFALQWAKGCGIECDPALLRRLVDDRERERAQDEDFLVANGLSRRGYERLARERALYDWLSAAPVSRLGPAAGDAEEAGGRSLVRAWARDNGVDESRIDWILDEGPDGFGITWSFEVALLQELQWTGRAATLAEERSGP